MPPLHDTTTRSHRPALAFFGRPPARSAAEGFRSTLACAAGSDMRMVAGRASCVSPRHPVWRRAAESLQSPAARGRFGRQAPSIAGGRTDETLRHRPPPTTLAAPAPPWPPSSSACRWPALVLGLILFGPLHDFLDPPLRRAPRRVVEVLLFCCALGTLGAKLWQNLVERRACAAGAVAAPGTASRCRSPRRPSCWPLSPPAARLQNTYLVQRVAAVLDFLCQRRSADELDDQLRDPGRHRRPGPGGQLRPDALHHLGHPHPRLPRHRARHHRGHLRRHAGGAGQDLSSVTDGLAWPSTPPPWPWPDDGDDVLSFLVERAEQGVLEAVDRYVERAAGPPLPAPRRRQRPVRRAWCSRTRRCCSTRPDSSSSGRRTCGPKRSPRRTAPCRARRARQQEQPGRRAGSGAGADAAHPRPAPGGAGEAGRRAEREAARAAGGAGGVVRDTGREQQAALARVAEGWRPRPARWRGCRRARRQLVQLQAAAATEPGRPGRRRRVRAGGAQPDGGHPPADAPRWR